MPDFSNPQAKSASAEKAPESPKPEASEIMQSWGELTMVSSAREIFAYEPRLTANQEGWSSELRSRSESKLIEQRFLHIVQTQGLDAVADISRPDLVHILRKAEYADTVLHVAKLLGTPQGDSERKAFLELLEVNRTPTFAAAAKAITSEIITSLWQGPRYWKDRGLESPTETAMPERRGPRIWSDVENVPLGRAISVPGARLNFSNSFDAKANRERVMEVLSTISSALSDSNQATTAIARLAINLESEERGLKPGDEFVAKILADAFPMIRQKSDSPSFEMPSPPDGLDSRERKILKEMFTKYVN